MQKLKYDNERDFSSFEKIINNEHRVLLNLIILLNFKCQSCSLQSFNSFSKLRDCQWNQSRRNWNLEACHLSWQNRRYRRARILQLHFTRGWTHPTHICRWRQRWIRCSRSSSSNSTTNPSCNPKSSRLHLEHPRISKTKVNRFGSFTTLTTNKPFHFLSNWTNIFCSSCILLSKLSSDSKLAYQVLNKTNKSQIVKFLIFISLNFGFQLSFRNLTVNWIRQLWPVLRIPTSWKVSIEMLLVFVFSWTKSSIEARKSINPANHHSKRRKTRSFDENFCSVRCFWSFHDISSASKQFKDFLNLGHEWGNVC